MWAFDPSRKWSVHRSSRSYRPCIRPAPLSRPRGGGLLTLNNPANVEAGLTMRIRKTCSIAHEAAGNGIGLVGMACRDPTWRAANATSNFSD